MRYFVNAIDRVLQRIAPVWPLKDYVAVNPFLGYTSDTFLATLWKLSRVREGQMLMPIEHFRRRYRADSFGFEDVEEAIARCSADYPGLFDDLHPSDVMDVLLGESNGYPEGTGSDDRTNRVFWTLAESLDKQNGTDFQPQIVNEISRHLSAYYDQGQAVWANPWKHMTLFQAWREIMQWDRRAEKLGIPGLKSIAEQLPASPSDAVDFLLGALEVKPNDVEEFLACQLYSVSGWASYVKYIERSGHASDKEDEGLVGLLAIRLAYDFALSQKNQHSIKPFPAFRSEPELLGSEMLNTPLVSDCEAPAFDRSIITRYVCQVACEFAYQRKLTTEILSRMDHAHNHFELERDLNSNKARAAAQMVFCIDVRSEVMRRNLELVSSKIETLGFAGFFGLALEYVQLGQETGTPQCPVLLEPAFRVYEGVRGTNDSELKKILGFQAVATKFQIAWKSFQTAATSCFSFVESLGILYAPKLLANTFRLSNQTVVSISGIPQEKQKQVGPKLDPGSGRSLDLDTKVTLAESILRNMGLTDNFARLVVFCGHASETTNNPYRAGLDCGACGGHSGEPNARFAALLLNDPAVRKKLRSVGIVLPSDTVFVPAVHNTTTDEIKFCDVDLLPETHVDELMQLQDWTHKGAGLCRAERAPKLSSEFADDLLRRCADWSEVRPEWGLAGNAAFIVAPRSRTAGIELDGRSFLHNYDYRRDPEFKTLELIMTAPMVVANWINLQYYASTVDNQYYGSGNKVIHNVVGKFGTVLGNGGDLMTGLPFQSVHNGNDVQHEPLRLLVVIEAPATAIRAVMEKHKMVDDLVSNGWLNLLAIENGEIHPISADCEVATC